MRTLCVLPVKSFGSAKQRLAGELGGGSRHALAAAMLADTLAALRRTRGLDRRLVVTADPDADSAARGQGCQVLADVERGQSAAALAGVRYALAEGFERVLLVPGDVPLLDPAELEGLVREQEPPAATIVPDRHGEGTNALLLSPPDVFEPSFGPDSLRRHREAAEASDVPFSVREVESLALDVDTAEDLDALTSVLEARRGVAPRTRGALAQLGRSQAHARAAGSRRVGATA